MTMAHFSIRNNYKPQLSVAFFSIFFSMRFYSLISMQLIRGNNGECYYMNLYYFVDCEYAIMENDGRTPYTYGKCFWMIRSMRTNTVKLLLNEDICRMWVHRREEMTNKMFCLNASIQSWNHFEIYHIAKLHVFP